MIKIGTLLQDHVAFLVVKLILKNMNICVMLNSRNGKLYWIGLRTIQPWMYWIGLRFGACRCLQVLEIAATNKPPSYTCTMTGANPNLWLPQSKTVQYFRMKTSPWQCVCVFTVCLLSVYQHVSTEFVLVLVFTVYLLCVYCMFTVCLLCVYCVFTLCNLLSVYCVFTVCNLQSVY